MSSSQLDERQQAGGPSSPRPRRSTAISSRLTTSPSKFRGTDRSGRRRCCALRPLHLQALPFLGDQDTLFADYGRQYYADSFIAGGVDFIFGNASAVFDHDTISEIRNGEITAQSRTSPEQTTGYVIDHSRITHDPVPPPPGKTAGTGFGLGRPWRAYARVVVMNTELPADLNTAGWSAWNPRDTAAPTAYYAEFHNTGPCKHLAARLVVASAYGERSRSLRATDLPPRHKKRTSMESHR